MIIVPERHRQTDGQTNRWTDDILRHIIELCAASRGKNGADLEIEKCCGFFFVEVYTNKYFRNDYVIMAIFVSLLVSFGQKIFISIILFSFSCKKHYTW